VAEVKLFGGGPRFAMLELGNSLGSRREQEAIAMANVGKAVPWRSCREGHVYLGQECPCEHVDAYKASLREARSGGSRDWAPGTARVAEAGRQPTIEWGSIGEAS
jgi:hypothetical protein